MRWKWRLGLLLIAAVEGPLLLWISTVMQEPAEIVLYAGVVLAAVLVTMLIVRPLLFGIMGAWLGGIAGAAWYFVRYLPPAVALGFGAILSTLVCAIGAPFYFRGLGFLLRRHG